MNVRHLIVREAAHRKFSFLLGLVAVAAAAASFLGAQTVLQADRIVTSRTLADKESEIAEVLEKRQQDVEAAGADLQDAMRKHMKGLGFNVLILPAETDLAQLHLGETPSATMPENYVDRLSESKIVTINHLLPSVTQRIHWPEQDLDVILQGTRGEVPLAHRALKKPLLDAVAPGQVVVGHAIHTRLGLEVGDPVRIMDREFTVSTLHDERGSSDDVTLWIDLATAQEMLGLENLIHAILALECDCAGDRISMVRAEIAGVLPGTQVIERHSQALARAEARAKAKATAEEALAQQQAAATAMLKQVNDGRAEIEANHARLAGVLVPLVVVVSVVLIGGLAMLNVRQRREELGILRAIGLRTRQIFAAFLGRAVLIGVLGGVVGCAAGLGVGIAFGPLGGESDLWDVLWSAGGLTQTTLITLLVAPLLAAAGSWIPALLAVREDAAIVLQGE